LFSSSSSYSTLFPPPAAFYPPKLLTEGVAEASKLPSFQLLPVEHLLLPGRFSRNLYSRHHHYSLPLSQPLLQNTWISISTSRQLPKPSLELEAPKLETFIQALFNYFLYPFQSIYNTVCCHESEQQTTATSPANALRPSTTAKTLLLRGERDLLRDSKELLSADVCTKQPVSFLCFISTTKPSSPSSPQPQRLSLPSSPASSFLLLLFLFLFPFSACLLAGLIAFRRVL
jgi:hypothetical protein